MKRVRIQFLFLNGEKRLRIIFDKDDNSLARLICMMQGCMWSSSLQDWHIPYMENYLSVLNSIFPDDVLFYDITDKYNFKLCTELVCEPEAVFKNRCESISQGKNLIQTGSSNTEGIVREYSHKMKTSNYSSGTIRQYTMAIENFLNVCSTDPDIAGNVIKSFVDEISFERRYSRSTQNQIINSVRLYFLIMYEREIDKTALPRPRRERKLPEVLSKDEINRIILSVQNIKHRAMITTAYFAGMTLDEVLSLIPSDIVYSQKFILIRGKKGKRDRQVPLSCQIEESILLYLSQYHPSDFLFEGISGGKYSGRSLQKIIRAAVFKAQIRKRASIQTLRHSFAAHLMESGTESRVIRNLMGHSCVQTTEKYRKVIA